MTTVELPFYQRSEVERIAMTKEAIRLNRTLTLRWSALNEDEAEPWSGRAAAAANWLEDANAVLDLGCGTMLLERYLPYSTRYYPSDVFVRDSRTIVCDYNQSSVPQIDADTVTCLGLLEYIHGPERLLIEIECYRVAIISYCITDAPGALMERHAHGWVNDFSTVQMQQMFSRAGWIIDRTQMFDASQRIWRLVRPH